MSVAPKALAAVDEVLLSSREITLPRITRVSDVQPKMISTSEIVQMLRVGKTARNTIAPRMNGRPKKMSVIRPITVSVNPPNQPAAVPSTTPRITVPAVTRIATMTDLPVPLDQRRPHVAAGDV